jgi:hypothetical protein
MEKQVSNPGLYANIHKKREAGKKMRKAGDPGAPTASDFEKAAQTAKKKDGGMVEAKYMNGGCVMAGRGVRNTKMG